MIIFNAFSQLCWEKYAIDQAMIVQTLPLLLLYVYGYRARSFGKMFLGVSGR